MQPQQGVLGVLGPLGPRRAPAARLQQLGGGVVAREAHLGPVFLWVSGLGFMFYGFQG
jgi:hypothetical protein